MDDVKVPKTTTIVRARSALSNSRNNTFYGASKRPKQYANYKIDLTPKYENSGARLQESEQKLSETKSKWEKMTETVDFEIEKTNQRKKELKGCKGPMDLFKYQNGKYIF